MPTCSDCKKLIADIVAVWSSNHLGRPLCLDCQEKEKKKRGFINRYSWQERKENQI